MAALPERKHTTAAAIFAHYERQRDGEQERPYLGASVLGHSCARYLWLGFRWARRGQFPGRVLRLFNTGHREEARIVADLRAIGCEVHEVGPDGSQFGVEFCGGHGRGHLDAAILGLPEAPRTWHVGEFKTHNDKSFKDLCKKGVQAAKPMHYAQMIVYAGLTGMGRMFYLAVNKNTDEIYTERCDFDPIAFAQLMARAERVIFGAEPPARVSTDPDWYECLNCSMRGVCHETAAPDVNCRTCAHVTPCSDGTWKCERPSAGIESISTDAQRVGCSGHRYIPILIEQFAEFKDGGNGNPEYSNKLTGRTFVNGDGGYASAEISACQDKRALGDAGVDALREQFDGRVVA